MVIPPVILNNPIFKLFRADKPDIKQPESGAGATAEDIVEISVAAQQRLDGIRALPADHPEDALKLAGETRHILEGTGVTLGLNSDSS